MSGQGEVSPFGRSYSSVGNLAGLPGGGQGYGWGRMDPSYAGLLPMWSSQSTQQITYYQT